MNAARVVASIVALIACATAVPAAFAQEAAQPSIFLRQMTQPTQPLSAGSITRDDLRDAPAPPAVDRLRDAVRFDVGIVGDPRCLPGEGLSDLGPVRSRGIGRRAR